MGVLTKYMPVNRISSLPEEENPLEKYMPKLAIPKESLVDKTAKLFGVAEPSVLEKETLGESARISAESQLDVLKNIPRAFMAAGKFKTTPEDQEAMRKVSTFPLTTLARIPSAIQAGISPLKGKGRIESAAQAFLRPEALPAGYSGGEIAKKMNPKLWPVAGTLGSLLDIASFEIGSGGLARRLKAGYKDAVVNELTEKALKKYGSKFPAEFTEADKRGLTRAWVLKELPKHEKEIYQPKLMGKILTKPLASEVGTAELPGKIPPKDIAKSLIPPAAGGIPKIPLPTTPITQPEPIEQGKQGVVESTPTEGKVVYIGNQEGKPQGKYIYGAESKEYAKNFGEQITEHSITPKNTFDLTPLEETSISFDKFTKTLKDKGVEVDKSIIGDDDVYKPAWQWIRKYPVIADKIKEAGFDSIKQLETFTGKGKKELTYQVLDNKILSPRKGIPSETPPTQTMPSPEIVQPSVSQRAEIPVSASEKADYELFMKDYMEAEISLKDAVKKMGGVKSFKFGKEVEKHKEIPKELRSQTGMALDDMATELSSYGFNFESGEELRQALISIPMQKDFKVSEDVRKYLRQEKRGKSEVLKIGRKLQKPLAQAKVKPIVRQATGQYTPEQKTIIESFALKQSLKRQQKTSKVAFREGRKLEAEIRKRKYFGSEITKDQRRELYVLALRKGVIYADYTGKTHDKLQGIIRFYKGASFDQLKTYISNLTGDKENPAKLFKLYGDINKDSEALKIINEERKDWQDITPIEVYSLDPPRIVEKVTKQNLWDGNILADNTFNIVAAADEAMFDRKVKELGDLDTNRQGVTARSKESSEIMRKFEAKEPLTEKEQKVVDYLRKKYDALIAEANGMRDLLGKKPIPYRQDYMTHIIEQNILVDFFKGDDAGMESISDAQMDAIRKGDYTKGNMPFNKFAQKRMGEKTRYDAIGNYVKYLTVIMKEIYYTPAITHSRKFIEYALNRQPNAFKALDRLLNDLKGKVSIVDQNLIGNIAGSVPIKWIRTHISRSALIGNINFWTMNMSNFATSYDEIGNWLNIGMAKFLGSKKWRQFAFENSKMLKGRAIDPDFIDQPIPMKLEELVGDITNLIEYNNVGSTFVGAYCKGIEELGYSQEKAIEYADSIARRTQVGYKPYEVNAWMRSNSGKLMSQFQTWTFNAMNHILYDLGVANVPEDIKNMFTDKKTNRTRWGALLTLIVTAISINALYRKMGLREPYQPSAAVPGVAGFRLGRYNDIGPTRIARDIGTSFTGKKPETRIRARQRVLGSVIPGGTQATRFLQGRVFPEQHGKLTGGISQKTKTKSKRKSAGKLKF